MNPGEQNIAENVYISLTGREIAGNSFAFLVSPKICCRFGSFGKNKNHQLIDR